MYFKFTVDHLQITGKHKSNFSILIQMNRLLRWAPLLLIGILPLPLQAQGRRPPWPVEKASVVLNGDQQRPLNLYRVDDVPCVPLSDVRRIFGGRVTWHRVARKFVYHQETREAHFQLDSSTAVIQGKAFTLETSVRWWGDTAYLPFSLLTSPAFQSFVSAKVQWDEVPRQLTVEPIPSVSSPRVFVYPENTRLTLEMSPEVDYRVLGQRENRLTLRLFNGIAAGMEKFTFDEGGVAAVEVRPRQHTTDLVLTLKEGSGTPDIYTTESPRALVIDVPQATGGKPPSATEPVTSLPSALPVPTLRAPGLQTPARPANPLDAAYLALSPIKTIVIDAGHGGKDVGALGPRGTYEKDANLRIALALAKVLKNEKRFNVILTRTDDRFLELQERSAIANKKKADLFISIHCNAGLSDKSNGFEIYFLSEKATDDEAASVARRENAVVDLEGVTGPARQKLEFLLASLARNEHINDSSELAARMARQAGQRLPVTNRGVKQAGFYVLRGTSMPAVLVETAFITHPSEERLLKSPGYAQKVADALFAGLLDFEKRKIQIRMAEANAGGN